MAAFEPRRLQRAADTVDEVASRSRGSNLISVTRQGAKAFTPVSAPEWGSALRVSEGFGLRLRGGTHRELATGEEWQYEIKLDGYLLAIHVELNCIRIITRGGHNWTDRFAGIAAAARESSPRTLILDGEAVVLDEQGRSSFSALQKALGGRGGKRNAGEAIFYAFDLLYLDSYDLTKLGRHERRQMLQDLLEGDDGAIRLSETIEADGDELLKPDHPALG